MESPSVDAADVKFMFFEMLMSNSDIEVVCAEPGVFFITHAHNNTPTHSSALIQAGEVLDNLLSMNELAASSAVTVSASGGGPQESCSDGIDSSSELSGSDCSVGDSSGSDSPVAAESCIVPCTRSSVCATTIIQNNYFCSAEETA